MIRPFSFALAVTVFAVSAASSFAQAPAKSAATAAASRKAPSPKGIDPYSPTVLGMVTNANELLRDIETAMNLTGPADQRQWPELIKYLDVFLTGVDRTRVARMDVIFGDGTYRYRPSFPIPADQLGNFRDNNLASLGIQSRQMLSQVYRLSNAFEGFMRYKDEYASLAEKQSDIPSGFPDPTVDIAHLIAKNYHAAIDGRNVNDGQEDRRRSFEKAHKAVAAALKRAEKETLDEFAVRRALLDWRYHEYQRFYVEASRFLLGGNIDNTAKAIRFDVEVAPIAGTPLEASILSTREHASRFAVVERCDNPILSLRLNFPLDELRTADLSRIIGLYRATSLKDIDASTERSAEEKQHTKQAARQFYDLVDAILKSGRLDGFVEGHANPSGKNTLIGAGVIPDGDAVLAILEVLPKTGKGNTVELNIDGMGDVKLHRVAAPSGFRADFKDFFGEETVLVGIAKNVLWLGCGENSLSELKAAIQTVADGGDEAAKAPPTLIDGTARLGVWMEFWNKRRGTKGDPKLRERAINAFRAGDDVLIVDLKPIENRIEGKIEGKTGVMRFIGALLAEFTRNVEK